MKLFLQVTVIALAILTVIICIAVCAVALNLLLSGNYA